jgi:ribonuclease T1
VGRRGLAGGSALAALIAVALVALLGGEEPIREPTGSAFQQGALSAEEAAGVTAVLSAIDSGEPLPFEQDGETFQNREGLLPDRTEGYYREYTVETPGSEDRGARRLVIGEANETFYTRDHYGSFIEIDPEDFR